MSNERILKKASDTIEDIIYNVSYLFESALNIQLSDFQDLKKKDAQSTWFQQIIQNLQLKYNQSTTNEKIQLLTLLPIE